MKNMLLIQLPIPQLNFGKQTGNVPLGAAHLKQAAQGIPDCSVDILPESIASYLGEAVLIRKILSVTPRVVGFTAACWNVERSLYIAQELKESGKVRIMFGGPEVTPDNPLIHSKDLDFRVYGEGERVFRRLLQDPVFWSQKNAHGCADTFFETNLSPYLRGFIRLIR
jgi:hypothetical protein